VGSGGAKPEGFSTSAPEVHPRQVIAAEGHFRYNEGVPSPLQSEPTPSIGALQERIHTLEQLLCDRNLELQVYQRVQQAINRQLDLQAVLQMIADQARLLTNCRSSTVYLLQAEANEAEPVLRLAVISGELDTPIRPGYSLPLSASIAGLAIREQKPYCVRNPWQDPRVFRDAIQRSNVTSFLIVPLISGQKAIGVISVANREDGELGDSDERILSLLASCAVISIENARLYAQAGEIAVLNERNRLARELHDAVTQTLFSASLIGDVLPTLWQANPAEGQRRLNELRGLTRGALAEMRMLLFELRPTALESAPLPELLRHLVNAFSGRTQIPVQLRCEEAGASPSELPRPVKVAFYRIAQEALNNIGKHAEAENVLLLFSRTTVSARLEVLEDGKGFDPSRPANGHFGLENMRERARAIGAALEINSQVGEGTTITLAWQANRDDLHE